MSSARQEATIGFSDPDQTEFLGRTYRGKSFIRDEWIDVCKGVRFKVIEIEGVDPLIADGAIVEFEPDSWSPFQFNASSETFFVDRPQHGEQVMVTCDPQGNVYVDFFNPDTDETPWEVEAGPGWLMATYALKTNTGPATRVEYEEPGFYNPETKLIDVERRTKSITIKETGKVIQIPDKFWEMVDKVEKGEHISEATYPNERI